MHPLSLRVPTTYESKKQAASARRALTRALRLLRSAFRARAPFPSIPHPHARHWSLAFPVLPMSPFRPPRRNPEPCASLAAGAPSRLVDSFLVPKEETSFAPTEFVRCGGNARGVHAVPTQGGVRRDANTIFYDATDLYSVFLGCYPIL